MEGLIKTHIYSNESENICFDQELSPSQCQAFKDTGADPNYKGFVENVMWFLDIVIRKLFYKAANSQPHQITTKHN